MGFGQRRLGVTLGLQLRFKAAGHRVAQQVAGAHQRLCGHGRQALGQGLCGGDTVLGHIPHHTPFLGLGGRQLVAGHGESSRARQTQAVR